MTPADATPRFPLAPAAAAVSAASLVAGVAALWITAGVTQSPVADVLPAVLTMTVATWALALLALAPMAMLATPARDPQYVVAACMAGTTLRLLASLLAAAAAVTAFHLQPKPVAVALLSVYLPVLVVEVAMLARYIRAAHAAQGAVADRPAMEVSV